MLILTWCLPISWKTLNELHESHDGDIFAPTDSNLESVGFAWLTLPGWGWLWLNITYPSWHLEYHGLHCIPLKPPWLMDRINLVWTQVTEFWLAPTDLDLLWSQLVSLKLMWTSFESLEFSTIVGPPCIDESYRGIIWTWFEFTIHVDWRILPPRTHIDLLGPTPIDMTALTAFRSVHLL